MHTDRIPIIAIVGPTGIGKTKLGIVLARSLGGEVVSIDSLQVYRDAAIMSAQPTTKEMNGVPHHLVNYLDANEEPQDYVERALAAIKQVHCRGKVPILVGGSTSLTAPLLFHPFVESQKPHIIVLYSHLPLLYKRLDDRVDQMVDEGLGEEVQRLYDLEQKLLDSPDMSRGVWKAIGYPELRDWAEMARSSSSSSSSSSGQDPQAEEWFNEGSYKMKVSTRKYAETQLCWLWSELIPAMQMKEMDFATLKVTSGSVFNNQVVSPAISQCYDWLEWTCS